LDVDAEPAVLARSVVGIVLVPEDTHPAVVRDFSDDLSLLLAERAPVHRH